MKKLVAIFLFAVTQFAFAQSSIVFNESWFGDNITYVDDRGQEQKMGIAVYKVDDTPRRTVIYLHTCGGPNKPYARSHIEQFRQWGYNVVVPDSYRYRGVGDACSNIRYLETTPNHRVSDLHAAAKWTLGQSWNIGKPATVGFSHGAVAIHMASDISYSKTSKALLSSAVAFYPLCTYDYNVDWQSGWPVQIHVGGLDNLTPAWRCERYSNVQGETLQYNHYPTAYHGWDLGINTTQFILGKQAVFRSDNEITRQSYNATHAWLEKFFQ